MGNSHRIAVELTGLDRNPDTIAIAAEACLPSSRIQWVAADIFSFAPRSPFHLVVSSLFTHHLTEQDIVRFLKWMESHCRARMVHQRSLPRRPSPTISSVSSPGWPAFTASSSTMALCPLRELFQPQDWQAMCPAAGLDQIDFVIKGFKPARLCVSRRIPQHRSQPA